MTDAVIGWQDKAVWPAEGTTEEEFLASSPSLFDGTVSWPAMVLREDALRANAATLADFCRRHGLEFAPHGKTTMAPDLFRMQLEAGAWGISLATAQQVRVARGFGVERVLLAHQLLDATALDWIAADLERNPDVEFACFVDSSEGVRAAAAAGVAHPSGGGFPVILDIGYPGGRTGTRTPAEAHALAQEIRETPGVRLAGVSGYEGGLKTVDEVRDYFAEIREIVTALADDDLLPEHPIVTAGGSAYFDLVAEEFGAWASERDARVILRSGAYLTHDNGLYERVTPFVRVPGEGSLDPAIEVWAQVVSAPEDGIAFAGLGRRDVSFDNGMPVPLLLRRAGASELEVLSGRVEVTKLNDQHCYLRSTDLELRPGDLVGFGISHPCTTFDKWRVVPLIDDDYRITGLARTYF